MKPTGLPEDLWAQVLASVHDADADSDAIGKALVAWADGRKASDLIGLLDALREATAYPVSLFVLENAWSVDLPPDKLGAIAQDWMGTILFGLGDREGAERIARKITPRAIEISPQLSGDLGDLLLSWSLREVARPLVQAAVDALPGDTSHRFNLGVLQKFSGEWAASRDSFKAVLQHKPSPQAWWNLGVAATALRDFDAAREAWQRVGLAIPDGTGDFAEPGAPTPVSLATTDGAPASREVVWGERLCPARVVLRGLPRWPAQGSYGDVVLIDGAPIQEIEHEGERVPVLPALAVFEDNAGETYHVVGDDPALSHDLTHVALRLNEVGWPAANWSQLPGERAARLGLMVPRDRTKSQALAALRPLIEDLPLRCPELDL